MTKVYFVRHAQSDYSVRNSRERPLTEKGRNDCRLVTDYLSDKKIDTVLSSPYRRAVDTVTEFADKYGYSIKIIEDFHECKSDHAVRINKTDGHRISDNPELLCHLEKQWADFNYTLSDGERLSEVQKRNITALNEVFVEYRDKNIVIATHGIALSTIIHFYDSTFGFANFLAMADKTPWIVEMDFDGQTCVEIRKIDLFV